MRTIAANTAPATSPIEDVFTPSAQTNTAQEAGLFQLNQFSLFPALQAAQTTATYNPQGVPAAIANADTVQPVTTVSVQTAAPGTQQVAALPSPNVPPANPQNQIQYFNQVLTALGLQNNDIQKLDQIATLVNDFSPTAFTDLINQFRALAQQQSQIAASAPAAATNAISGGYQVQGLAIQFAGSKNEPNPSGAQTGGQNNGTPAGLQIQGVQFSLLNGAGQTVNLLAPLPNTTAAGAAQSVRGAAV
ncbi:MAG: hypothetical protein ACRD4Y_06020 [Candidatus Acidiferrales bacterium]